MLWIPAGMALIFLACSQPVDDPGSSGPVPVPGTGSQKGAPVAVVPSPSGSSPVGLPSLPAGRPGPKPPTLMVKQPGTCDPCSLLLEHDFDALQAGKACRLCGEVDPSVCDGWPEPGTVSCDTYDWLRNCIYARLGYDFETAEDWRVTFDQEPWYTPDPRFRWSKVSAVQNRNAVTLRTLVKKRRCAR